MNVQVMLRWSRALVDPYRMLGLTALPRFFATWQEYQDLCGPDKLEWQESFPCLSDWTAHTPFDPHYFYQASWIARKLAKLSPATHVDIGSSVQMIGAVSGFVPTVFLDYRPLHARLPNLVSLGGNILRLPFADESIPSLSCLHVIEHIGLGRYGDPLDPNGSLKAARELARVLAPSGRLFLTTPVGRGRLQFNAHRIFAPESVLAMFDNLQLVDFSMVGDDRKFYSHVDPTVAATGQYVCGMFEFQKTYSGSQIT